ncbi:MAG TPA: histidine kinase [Candidatus Dormibacteraeota bacterium]|nr:histidine kinase [Candidatus Dormibacteraeota bacterium]
MTTDSQTGVDASVRVLEVRSRAADRLVRQRAMFRPLGWVMIAAVVAGAAGTTPAPARSGEGLGVALALGLFAALLAVAIRDGFTRRPLPAQAGAILAMGGAGVALAALQPQGITGLASSAAVWMALARLPLRLAIPVGSAITLALAVAAGVATRSGPVVFSAMLLCAVLALVAQSVRQARESQDRTEVLMAELEDAREEQTRAAALAERARIAGELHDVLAHSLSGAAIQLQGARVLAERDGAGTRVRGAIDRAVELVRDGLASAQAVGALRGDALPGVDQLPALVERVRSDLEIGLVLSIEGAERPVPAEAGLALYRGAQEALTNVARHAPGATATVTLRYADARTTLTVENGAPRSPGGEDAAGRGADLRDAGGGRGLSGLRERLERVGGSVDAGPTAAGWRVVMDVPA